MTKKVAGGARQTAHIQRRVTQSIFRAFDYAEHIGCPLNTYSVVNIRETSAAAAGTVFERIRHKYRDWLTYQSRKRGKRYVPTYVYSFENPDDAQPHVNWVLHLPPELQDAFYLKLPRWVERAQGSIGPFDIDCQAIEPGTEKTVAKYVVKGTDPEFADHFFLTEVMKRSGPQGTTYGKRAGVSPSLGHAARAEAGFRVPRGRWRAFRARSNDARPLETPRRRFA